MLSRCPHSGDFYVIARVNQFSKQIPKSSFWTREKQILICMDIHKGYFASFSFFFSAV